MQPALSHECTCVPVTALASFEDLLIAAEGPFLRFYDHNGTRFLATQRVFKSQAVHGISIDTQKYAGATRLIIWGGRLVRVICLELASTKDHEANLSVESSNVAIAPEWILDLALQPCLPEDVHSRDERAAVAVTARNALLRLVIGAVDKDCNSKHTSRLSVSALTADTRSTLYSAHLFWESPKQLLIAAGTAFGEIIYWSWNCGLQDPITQVHKVFVGHEGSIFGVRISALYSETTNLNAKRMLASCSDDRTLRIWDISPSASDDNQVTKLGNEQNIERVHHTGFINAAIDSQIYTNSDCLAIGWGHTSRVWNVQFLNLAVHGDKTLLLSAGEDATTRLWQILSSTDRQIEANHKLLELGSTGHHNGKNIWSTTIFNQSKTHPEIICGGSDSKITAHSFIQTLNLGRESMRSQISEYSISEILSMARSKDRGDETMQANCGYKSSRQTEFLRGYCFVKDNYFILTTNLGRVLLAHIGSKLDSGEPGSLSQVDLIDQLPELSGYSICASEPSVGAAFLAGSKGDLFMYNHSTAKIVKVLKVTNKIGNVLISRSSGNHKDVILSILVTHLGQKRATFVQINTATESETAVLRSIDILIEEHLTGSTISSMVHVDAIDRQHLLVGFRRGSIALHDISILAGKEQRISTLDAVLEKIHGDETVTGLVWVPKENFKLTGNLYSTGRDGRLVIHDIDLQTSSATIVHSFVLPIGPNVEGLYLQKHHLLVHGFSSKKWVLYDVTAEEEMMEVETGGAHRSWTFYPRLSCEGSATMVWTRASSMQICSQSRPNHRTIRSGGHGREIKAVAAQSLRARQLASGSLIATGAEDTDIKLFQYSDGELVCRSTLRRHTTGIQHLQWSENGDYLFSSGGCEEFYIWRIRRLRSYVQIGVVCEHVYAPESEDADLRIMSFDVMKQDPVYTIVMVFSDSSVKVYGYNPATSVRWQSIAKGTYLTSCLTQCVFLSPSLILTAGTDGHAAVWPLALEPRSTNAKGSTSFSPLKWESPIKIHQNTSKTMSAQDFKGKGKLIVSGGDDGSIAFLLLGTNTSSNAPSARQMAPATVVKRTHASAVTACAIVSLGSHIFVLTSGNDEWVRLWEVLISIGKTGASEHECQLDVKQKAKVKTSVADVSSMTVLEIEDQGLSSAKVLLCGVGMEVIRVAFEGADAQAPATS